MLNMTVRKDAKAQRRIKQPQLRAVLESAVDSIVSIDHRGTVLEYNAAAERMFGWSRRTALGQSMTDLIIPPALREQCRQGIARYVETGKGKIVGGRIETTGLRADGTEFPVELTAVALKGQDPPLFTAYIRDITERKRAEETLRQSEEKFRLIFNNTNDAVFILDLQGRFLEVNQVTCDRLWYTRDEMLRMSLLDIDPPEFALRIEERIRAILDSGYAVFETAHVRRDGTVIPVEVGSRTITYEGRPALLSVVRDITERKRAEKQTTVLLETVREIGGTLDLDELLERVQQRTAQGLGCDIVLTASFDRQRQVLRVLSGFGLAAEGQPQGQALEWGLGSEFAAQLARAETVVRNDVLNLSEGLGEMANRLGVAAIVATPLELLEQQPGTFVAIRTGSGKPFEPTEVDLCTAIAGELGVAIGAVRMYRAQQEEAEVSGALARVGQDLISALNTPAVIERLRQVSIEDLHCDFSYAVLWKECDGAYVPVSGYGMPLEEWEIVRLLKASRAMVADLLSTAERDSVVRLREVRHPGWGAIARQLGIAEAIAVPLRRGQETIGVLTAGYRGGQHSFSPRQERIFRGIAHLASMALDNVRLMEELERANSIKSEFVATMSHELRTPINILIGYTELMREQAFGPLTAEQSDTLRRMNNSSQGLLDLINATLDLSRLEANRLGLEVSEVRVDKVLRELEAEIADWRDKPEITFRFQAAPDLPPLRTDAVKLKLILKNLINNAFKFTDHGRIVVQAARRAGGIEVAVTDTGIGIPRESLPIIFEPFRQVDAGVSRRHGGVGLGLHIVRRLLDLLEGSITVESELGRGSTFRVWLPLPA